LSAINEGTEPSQKISWSHVLRTAIQKHFKRYHYRKRQKCIRVISLSSLVPGILSENALTLNVNFTVLSFGWSVTI
jgi:hypothetical protein